MGKSPLFILDWTQNDAPSHGYSQNWALSQVDSTQSRRRTYPGGFLTTLQSSTETPYTSAAITKITRRITMHKNTRSILEKPFSNKGKTQQSFAIFSREDPPNHKH
jgi:hypothetical protein